MAEQVDFYLLGQANTTEKFKFACRLAHKAYARGLTVYMQTGAEDQSRYLDKLLWTFSQESFVPHTLREGQTDWRQYPVQIGPREGGSDQVDLLITLQSAVPDDYHNYRRVADLITDDAHEKQAGRARYRVYRDNGLEPQTHKM